MLRRFIQYYKPHKRLFIMDMLASLLVSVFAIFYPILTRLMLNDLIPNRNYRMIVAAGLLMLGLYFLRLLLNYFIQYYGHIMGIRMQAEMRSQLFGKLQTLPFSFYDNHETGKIMSRLTNDLMDIAELAHHGPETLIISSLSVILSIIYLWTIHWCLALIILACVPLLIAVSLVTRKKMRLAFQESKKAVAGINASLESSISGVRVTKAFTNQDKELEKFEVQNEAFKSASKNAYRQMAIFHSSTSFITDIFNVVILIAGGMFMYAGKINFADYSAFIVSVNLFLNPINTLLRFMEMFQNGFAGFDRFTEVMDLAPEADLEGAEDAGVLSGDIEFRNVSYSYNEGQDVLHDVSLKIKAGCKYALVGPSGGGKTTICHLIPHFYEVSEGDILLDGRSIRTLTRASLRRNIGIVQQDIFLFNTSIRDNILYGRLDATEEEVIEAAKSANIHDYIISLPEGYDTVIGERGVRLSGGQKQRLCMARIFLKNPAILILDEATSALDNTTELLIQQSLDRLCEGRTTLVVAHRLSTIKNADEIAVISEGQILEQGSHEDLLALDGVYADLYRKQFREEL